MDEKTAEGPHLHSYRPWTHEKVAVGHKASARSVLSMWGESERGPPNEMPTGGGRERKESRTGVGRQRVVSGGGGVSELRAEGGRISFPTLCIVFVYVRNGDESRDRLWGGIITGAYPRLMRSLVIDLHRLNTSNDSQKKKKRDRIILYLGTGDFPPRSRSLLPIFYGCEAFQHPKEEMRRLSREWARWVVGAWRGSSNDRV